LSIFKPFINYFVASWFCTFQDMLCCKDILLQIFDRGTPCNLLSKMLFSSSRHSQALDRGHLYSSRIPLFYLPPGYLQLCNLDRYLLFLIHRYHSIYHILQLAFFLLLFCCFHNIIYFPFLKAGLGISLNALRVCEALSVAKGSGERQRTAYLLLYAVAISISIPSLASQEKQD